MGLINKNVMSLDAMRKKGLFIRICTSVRCHGVEGFNLLRLCMSIGKIMLYLSDAFG